MSASRAGARSDFRSAPFGSATGSDVARATLWGLLAAGIVVAGIVVGSRGLKDFDTALVPYAGASVFAAFGLGYRHAMWLRRPPTRLYWFRGWKLIASPANAPVLLVRIGSNLLAQAFIFRRGRLRWAAHFAIFWGCLLAAAVTFPLSFGWIRFETARDSQDIYRAFVFGIPVARFAVDGAFATLAFNVLDISAVLVLAGVALALMRRVRDRGALATQQLSADLVPLVLLFTISVSGLLLTVSTHLVRGFNYGFLSQLHAASVIFTLLYLPFGKFFHIFQRPAQVSIELYRREGAAGPQASCARCGQPFASQLQVGDLKLVQAALGIRYGSSAGEPHYQEYCPRCRRKMLAITQDDLWRAAGRARPQMPSPTPPQEGGKGGGRRT